MNKEIVQRIHELAEQADGTLTPARVLDDAKNEASPLHGWFEWDDHKASHKYRLLQARQLIRKVRIVVEVESREITAPYYVRDPRLPPKDAGYISVKKAKGDADLAREALVAEAVRLRAGLVRMRELAVYFGMQDQYDQMIERFDLMKAEAMNAPVMMM